jgi:hypothetical protein
MSHVDRPPFVPRSPDKLFNFCFVGHGGSPLPRLWVLCCHRPSLYIDGWSLFSNRNDMNRAVARPALAEQQQPRTPLGATYCGPESGRSARADWRDPPRAVRTPLRALLANIQAFRTWRAVTTA